MLLAIDVGNTNMVIGVYGNGPKAGGKPRLLHHWRMETKKERTADEFGIFFKELFQFAGLQLDQVDAIIISNVVPPLEFNLDRMCERYFKLKPLFVSPRMKMPIKIGLSHPGEVGADRIVNGVAGVVKYGSPLIVVDFGTATTFDFINKAKVYKGGCICPGIAISNEALFQHASKLPRVEIRKPSRIIGSNTVESIQAGIFYGYVGMVDEIVRRMQKEAKTKCKVVATGGFIGLISKASRTISAFDPYLTLEGLRLLHEFNRKGRKPGKK
ncbi:type III pantothenate kinase [Deltaproteobacteria bacterium PRO3]|nr:type III pantothenate kinase [Deltaproteobacteria bacterium PRO3]